jgi:predicted component of type VI protein secretion system
MSDGRSDGVVSLPFQGPHWRHDLGGQAESEVAPLRLRLRPGRFAVQLTRSGLVFGRHSSADVRLPLPDVSRQHCRFVYEAGRWQVIDLDSLNGVFVNDAPVRRADLHDHDTVRIGGFIFDVDMGGGESTLAVSDGRAGDSAGGLRSVVTALMPPEDGGLRRAS